MQKKVLLALFSILTLVIVGLLASLLQHEELIFQTSKEYPTPVQPQPNSLLTPQGWVKDFAIANTNTYQFAVNELSLQIDLKSFIPPKVKSFRLVIDKTDRYSLFCIAQTLASFDLPFVIEEKSKNPDIYITTQDSVILKDIVKRLNEYDIDSKMTEIWL
ncbi:MAG: hypothetical protein IBX44_06320 [Sulfurospirillum sp.]|nr:hypothetical protein [Sulfurospirillum sp.]